MSKMALAAAAGLLASALAGGCIGKAGPVEEYLRVSTPAACERAAEARSLPTVGLKRISAAEALDRQSVMLAEGRVMRPSLSWYWEAAPGRLMEQALSGALACSGKWAPVWPVRSASEAQVVLTGTVTDFQVQQRGQSLEAAVEFQAWDQDGKSLGPVKRVSASVPVRSMDAASIADAGAKALGSIAAEAATWLDRVAPRSRQ